MANQIRPRDLDPGTPLASADLIFDSGSRVLRTKPSGVVDAVAPIASQSDAETGASMNDRMPSLRVKQAIQAQAPYYDASGNVGIGAPSTGERLGVAGDVRIGAGGDLLISAALGAGRADAQIYNDDEDLWVRKAITGPVWLVCQKDERVGFGSQVSVEGSGRIRARALGGYCFSSWSNANYTAFQCVYNASPVGTITCTSSSTSFNTTSDQTLKDDLGETSRDAARALLAQIRIHDFNWKVSGEKDIGAFAQELVQICPRAVAPGGWRSEDGEDVPEGTRDAKYQPWGVDYSKLVPLLVASLQGALDQLAAQEERLARLESLAGGNQ